MPGPPKDKHAENPEPGPDRSSWSDDQIERGYYYDDAHGYEKYDPEDDDAEESD
jgi:hypothetical protein